MNHTAVMVILLFFSLSANGCFCKKADTIPSISKKQYSTDAIKQKDNSGNTKLHHAVRAGDLDMVLYLLKNGAFVNAKNYFGKTPLHIAAENGYAHIAEILIQYDANSMARDIHGKTALHGAAINGQVNTVLVILKSSSDINPLDNNQKTPLHLAQQFGHTDVVHCLHENIAARQQTIS